MLFSARVEYVCMIALIGLVTTNVQGVPFHRQFSKRQTPEKTITDYVKEVIGRINHLVNQSSRRIQTQGLPTAELEALAALTNQPPPLSNVDLVGEDAHRRHYERLHHYTQALNHFGLNPSDSLIRTLGNIMTEIQNLAQAKGWDTFTTPSPLFSISNSQFNSEHAAVQHHLLVRLLQYIHSSLNQTVRSYGR